MFIEILRCLKINSRFYVFVERDLRIRREIKGRILGVYYLILWNFVEIGEVGEWECF